MKPAKKKIKAKGDRLNWILLKEARPIKLSSLDIEGKIVIIPKSKSAKLLVP